MEYTNVQSLVDLANKAEKALGKRVRFAKEFSGNWNFTVDSPVLVNDRDGLSLHELIEHMRALAIPPKPATVTITVPYGVAEHYAKSIGEPPKCGVFMGIACREAIAPYEAKAL